MRRRSALENYEVPPDDAIENTPMNSHIENLGDELSPCASEASNTVLDQLPCLAPFSSLALRFDKFSVCCVSTAEAAVPEAPDSANGREAIFNDPIYRDLRQRMVNGAQLPRDCNACLAHNTTSQLFLDTDIRKIAASNLTRMDKSGRIHDFELAYAFANLDNQCNLACRTCSSIYSTTYARKIAAHATQLGHDRASGRRRSSAAAISLLSEAQVCVEFQGGEPFISPLFKSALDGMNKVQLKVITNGTLAPAKILRRLEHVENLTIWFSMDGARETNMHIRQGLDHDRFLKTLRGVKAALPRSELRINFTISRYNVSKIPSFLSELHSLGQIVDGFDYHFVEVPSQMRLTAIAAKDRQGVIEELAYFEVPPGPFAETAKRMIAHVSKELAYAPTQDPNVEAIIASFDSAVDAIGNGGGSGLDVRPSSDTASEHK